MTKANRLFRMIFLVGIALFLPVGVLVADVDLDSATQDSTPGITGRLGNIGSEAGLSTPTVDFLGGGSKNMDLPEYLGRIVFGLMSLLGVIFFALMVYGGFLWLYAGGNDEYVKKAQNIIKMAFIGFIIVLFAGGIVQFVTYYGNQ
ncbi:MAG: hypothetical protein AAB444_03685 [Patescibacteria group bacterium]